MTAATAIAVSGIAGAALAATPGSATAKPPVKVATAVTIADARSVVTAATKDQDTFTGVLSAGKLRLRGEPVSLREHVWGTKTWRTVATHYSGKAGGVSFTVTQSATKVQYELVFAGKGTYAASHSGVLTVVRR